MAIGLALLFNIRFPANFNSPYQAESVIDFWRRWHMTLSQFLRDYLYIRFGGNRLGFVRTHVNLLLTMLIGGLWHGAGWTFIIWGLYHGILLVLNHVTQARGLNPPRLLARALTFVAIIYGWVFFRSTSMSQALDMSQSLLGMHGFGLGETYFIWKGQFIFLIASLGIALFVPNTERWSKKIRPNLGWGILFYLLFVSGLLCLNRESAFLYFQF
jgi:D-alanyl-lipoteichoic acid acyltransferase DltB (MBOAT superfamily)